MQKYKSIDSGEIVFIAEDSGNLYTLSDGVKIMKSFFDKKYEAVKTGNESVDPEAFLNKSNFQHIVENQNRLKQIKQEINPALTDVVDPEAFLNSGSFDMNTINSAREAVKNPNMNAIPPSQTQPIVKEFSGEELNDIPGIDSYKKAEYLKKHAHQAPRLSETELQKYKQIDEDDPRVMEQFQKQEEIKADTHSKNKELLKKQHEEFLRQQAEETGTEMIDPALEKYNEKHKSETMEEQPNKTSKLPEFQNPPHPPSPKPASNFLDDFERDYTVSIDLTIQEKVPDLDVIKVLARAYKGDIIDYYAKDMLKNVLSDVIGLEKKIYLKLKELVFGPDEPDPEKIEDDPDIIDDPEKIEMINDISSSPLELRIEEENSDEENPDSDEENGSVEEEEIIKDDEPIFDISGVKVKVGDIREEIKEDTQEETDD